jgi:hypothetical protein
MWRRSKVVVSRVHLIQPGRARQPVGGEWLAVLDRVTLRAGEVCDAST